MTNLTATPEPPQESPTPPVLAHTTLAAAVGRFVLGFCLLMTVALGLAWVGSG